MSRTPLLICLAAALYAQGAAARVTQRPWLPVEAAAAPAQMLTDSSPRDRLITTLEHRYNAKVVRITDVMVDGRLAHDVRLLSNDRVWTVRVDAATGQELPRGN
jgi:hypothetical protein